MDESIDIEEHDLLDNPKIRRIFPDLTVLKKEIPEGTAFDNVAPGSHLHEARSVLNTSQISDNNENHMNISDHDSEGDIIFVDKRQPPVFSNKIILGSKPKSAPLQYKIEVDAEEITDKIYSSHIVLRNIGPYLRRSGLFCRICLILFPNQRAMQDHNKTQHNQKKSLEHSSMVFKCTKCHKDFRKHDLLVMHYRNAHNTNCRKKILNIKETSQSKVINRIRRKNEVPLLYVCLYCSYYFISADSCIKHIKSKHKDTSDIKLKPVSFDENCRYCLTISGTYHSHNVHLLVKHKNYVHRTFKVDPKIVIPRLEIDLAEKLCHGNILSDEASNYSCSGDIEEFEITNSSDSHGNMKSHKLDDSSKNLLILESVIFKCKRCDIHFLTSKSTINHRDHMEMLINWKCQICKFIFKKEDEVAHIQQHMVCSKLTVITLDETGLERVLYKCRKCSVHFLENKYLTHNQICNGEFVDCSRCEKCEIFIEDSVAGFHHDNHLYNNLKPSNFPIIETDVISVMSSKNEEVVKNDNSTMDIIESCTKEKTRTTETRILRCKFDNRLYYCGFCKFFVNTRRRHNHTIMHDMSLYRPIICKYCGLTFATNAMTAHRRLHQRRKNLKMQHFRFYDMNMKKIMPPLPDYPKCNICNVHFMSTIVLRRHVCEEIEFLTCHICNMKFLEPVFKLHMSFHYYSKTNQNISYGSIISINDNVKDVSESVNINLKNRLDREFTEPSKDREFIKKSIKINENNPKVPTGLSISAEKKSGKAINFKKNVNEPTDLNLHNRLDIGSIQKSDYELYNVLYCCSSCHAMIDTYDKMVQHCQDHIIGVFKEAENCSVCEMIVDRTRHTNHYKSYCHSNSVQESSKVITFDTFYFVLSNDIWLEHIFESISEEKRQLILNRSIYGKFKIKMKIMQEGSPDLTVYKCNICCNIVDSDGVLKHFEISCFKLRKHPCSHCGLPFLSYFARKEHETIHRAKNITPKSYRIVTFNDENDKIDNKLLTKSNGLFLLYQCRNCNVVIDKYKRLNHKCNNDHLMKCKTCNLLIDSSEFRDHCIKHKRVGNFVQRNMKVILFGQTERPFDKKDGMCFDGTFVDYALYQCEDCKVCFEKSQLNRTNHSMCPNDPKYKCLKCDLFILRNRKAHHLKMHERFVDFVKENMNIIPYSTRHSHVNFVSINNGEIGK